MEKRGVVTGEGEAPVEKKAQEGQAPGIFQFGGPCTEQKKSCGSDPVSKAADEAAKRIDENKQ